MSQELVYTSAPKGLQPGSRGFCTVAHSDGLGKRERLKLEGLSGYEFAFNLSDEQADLNPVNFLHTHVEVAGDRRHVLSRVSFCGADYSNRTNKIAHHYLLGKKERVRAGPGWALAKLVEHFSARWEEEPRTLPGQRFDALVGRGGESAPKPARAWERATGDAGWGGALLRAFRETPKVPAFVVFEAGTDILPLFAESLALLPPAERWRVCFATYFTALPPSSPCHWRGVLKGSKAASEASRFPNATIIDLSADLPRPPDDLYAEAAREGLRLPTAESKSAPGADESDYALLEDDDEEREPEGHWGQIGLSPVKRRRSDAQPAPKPIVPVVLVGLVVLVVGYLLFGRATPKADVAVAPSRKAPVLKTKTRRSKPPVDKTRPAAKTTPVEKTKPVEKTPRVVAKTKPVEKTAPIATKTKITPESRPVPKGPQPLRIEPLDAGLGLGDEDRKPLRLASPKGNGWAFLVPDAGITHFVKPPGGKLVFKQEGTRLVVGLREELGAGFRPIATLVGQVEGKATTLVATPTADDKRAAEAFPYVVIQLFNEDSGALHPLRAQPATKDTLSIRYLLRTHTVELKKVKGKVAYPLAEMDLHLEFASGSKKLRLQIEPGAPTRTKKLRISRDQAVRFRVTRGERQLSLELLPDSLKTLRASLSWSPDALLLLATLEQQHERLKGKGGERKNRKDLAKQIKKLKRDREAMKRSKALLKELDGLTATVLDAWSVPVRTWTLRTEWVEPKGKQ